MQKKLFYGGFGVAAVLPVNVFIFQSGKSGLTCFPSFDIAFKYVK